jgi:hypothetical protein
MFSMFSPSKHKHSTNLRVKHTDRQQNRPNKRSQNSERSSQSFRSPYSEHPFEPKGMKDPRLTSHSTDFGTVDRMDVYNKKKFEGFYAV